MIDATPTIGVPKLSSEEEAQKTDIELSLREKGGITDEEEKNITNGAGRNSLFLKFQFPYYLDNSEKSQQEEHTLQFPAANQEQGNSQSNNGANSEGMILFDVLVIASLLILQERRITKKK